MMVVTATPVMSVSDCWRAPQSLVDFYLKKIRQSPGMIQPHDLFRYGFKFRGNVDSDRWFPLHPRWSVFAFNDWHPLIALINAAGRQLFSPSSEITDWEHVEIQAQLRCFESHWRLEYASEEPVLVRQRNILRS
jgi:hypothetical protein